MSTIHILFNNKFSDFEEMKITHWIEETDNSELNLHKGMNYAVDVSDIIKRTANVDIEVE